MPDFLALLESAVEKRVLLRTHTTALRLVNGFGDGLEGLMLEQYGRHFVAQVFDQVWLARLDELSAYLQDRFDAQYFIVKDRSETASSRPEAINVHICIDKSPSRTVVEEGGLKFEVDLNDTLNSGLFLDMRANRKLVAGLARGRKVLNAFAYTCSFGVHCRAAGATALVNVDISRKTLDRGRMNYELNHLVPEKNEFIRADVLEYLERAVKKDNRFDLIILDPPSFARHEGKTFSVKKDLAGLIEDAVRVLNPGGAIFVSTNLSEMTHDAILGMITDAIGDREIKEVERLGQDIDFVGSGTMLESYLAAVLVVL